ncbi:MAG: JAB domain-containing protein [Cyclobacteriaceae bacterium]
MLYSSGFLQPSQSDFSLTKKVKEGGKLLEVQLLDYIVLIKKKPLQERRGHHPSARLQRVQCLVRMNFVDPVKGNSIKSPSLISFASFCIFYPRTSYAWLGYKTQNPGLSPEVF